jgi:hypothetical protein
MIAFDGRVPHSTVVEGGNVRMLGPFTWSQGNGFAFLLWAVLRLSLL